MPASTSAHRSPFAAAVVRSCLAFPALAITFTLPACIPLTNTNPTTGLSRAEAHAELKRLRTEPKPLERPVVILNGYHTPHFLISSLAERLRVCTSGRREDFLVISYVDETDLNVAAERVVRAVNARWPAPESGETIGVDVVALSMGGLVARLAALPIEQRPTVTGEPQGARPSEPSSSGSPARSDLARLNIVRLYTLASPHSGARLARYVALDDAARAMRSGSAFLNRLNERLPDATYELVCYAHLGDVTVGALNAAPPGMTPIWTDGCWLFSHGAIVENPWFGADIARRLRGEAPLLRAELPPPRN